MQDYAKLYRLLFNAITDALRRLDDHDAISARAILITAQQQAEEQYLEDTDGKR